MTTGFGCRRYVRAFPSAAQVPQRSPVALTRRALAAPATFVGGKLLPLHRLQETSRLVRRELLGGFPLGRAVSAARHGPDGRVGISLVAGHVVVAPAVIR